MLLSGGGSEQLSHALLQFRRAPGVIIEPPDRRLLSLTRRSARLGSGARLVHDRWIHKYKERHVSALMELKNELEGQVWQPRQKRK
jgi:hypothetical protein